jgi:hypothetical protein
MSTMTSRDTRAPLRTTIRPTTPLLVTFALLASSFGAGVGRAQESADALQEQALGVYFERCDVEPDSARERYARSDWQQLLDDGFSPELLNNLAGMLPEDCSYIAFKAGVLAMEREADTPKRPEPEPVETVDVEPDPYESTRRALQPMVTVGWAMTGTGLTLLGVGLAGTMGRDYQPWGNVVGTIGGQLFMTSLMITTFAGSAIYAGADGRYGLRPLRHVANGLLVVGGIALVVDACLLMMVIGAFFDGLGGGSGSGAPSAELANGLAIFALGALVTSSILGQVANTALLRDLGDRSAGGRTRAPAVRWGIVPTATIGGGGAVLVGRW